MSHALDLGAYLARVGWAGPVRPTPQTLASLAAAHAAAIPFENLNPFLGLPVSLDPAEVERKLVDEGRGGYCFEQNLLFMHVLRAIGFEVEGLAARILWGQPEDAITPRGHMLLKVTIAGAPYVADVGFGGMTLTGALRLVDGGEQATAHEPFRLVAVDGDWRLQAKVRDRWASVYRFDLQPQHPPDYEISNYYLSTHPRSHFVTGLIAARALPGRRLALRGRELAIHHQGGASERRILGSGDEIRETLEREFAIRLPEAPDLDARLARVAEG